MKIFVRRGILWKPQHGVSFKEKKTFFNIMFHFILNDLKKCLLFSWAHSHCKNISIRSYFPILFAGVRWPMAFYNSLEKGSCGALLEIEQLKRKAPNRNYLRLIII